MTENNDNYNEFYLKEEDCNKDYYAEKNIKDQINYLQNQFSIIENILINKDDIIETLSPNNGSYNIEALQQEK